MAFLNFTKTQSLFPLPKPLVHFRCFYSSTSPPGTKICVTYCLTNYPRTWQLKTINIYFIRSYMTWEFICGLAGYHCLKVSGGFCRSFSQGSGLNWRLSGGGSSFQAHVYCWQDWVSCWLLASGTLSYLSYGPLKPDHSMATSCPQSKQVREYVPKRKLQSFL